MASDESRKRYYGVKDLLEIVDDYILQNNVPITKLSSIRQALGEEMIIKRQIQTEKNELRQIKNDFVKSISIVEELEQVLANNNFQVIVPEYCHRPLIITNNNTMVVHITDWHIGYRIWDCKGNSYSWKIANERVDQLISECYKLIDLYNITMIYVVNTGDMIEHVSMRKNQSQFCKFNQSEQINHAIEIIYRLLVALNLKCNVEYDSIYGNHDRTNGDKSANLDGDNADTIIRRQIHNYNEIAKNVRLKVIERQHTDKEIVKDVNGKLLKFIHGETANKNDKIQIKNEISMDNVFYDVLYMGHGHNFSITSENNGRYIVSTGCLSGYNDYSCDFGCASIASQTITVICDGRIEIIKDVQLN